MISTRSHAPIREVVAEAGVQTYHKPSAGGTSRSALQEDEDTWMQNRDKSMAKLRGKRDKRRDVGWGTEEGYDGHDESGDDDETTIISESWGGMGHGKKPSTDIETEDDHYYTSPPREQRTIKRQPPPGRTDRRTTKKTTREFHVSNPDHDQSYSYGRREMRKQDPKKYGRNQEEAYMLTHDALAYSFGKS